MENKKVLKVEYPSNSHKSKEELESKKIEKIVKGKVVKKRKNFFEKTAEVFIGEDVDNVGSYILYDVLIPAAKNTLSDMVGTGIEMLLFGEAKRGSRTSRDKGKSYVSYSSYYDRREPIRDQKRVPSRQNSSRHNFDDIILDNRGEAEEVLSRLLDLIEDYEVATVADLYDLVGITSEFTDNKWGWTNLNTATVNRVRDGYLISLPRPMVLD